MGTCRKTISAALIASIGFIVAGCDAMDSITDMSIFDTKKKLPGDRKPVFPEGVPGVTQGIPPELQKGYSEQAAQPADPAAAAVEQLTAKPDPKDKKAKVAAKPKPKPASPPPLRTQSQDDEPPPARGQAAWPGAR